MLTAKNVSKYYPGASQKEAVLKDVSLHVTEGDFVAITGRSGSGKTTLLNALSTLTQVDDGEIYFNENNIIIDIHWFTFLQLHQ